MAEQFTIVERWAPIQGDWEMGPDSLTYTWKAAPTVQPTVGGIANGTALSSVQFDRGKVKTTISLGSHADAGRILLGYAQGGPRGSRCIFAGIGGSGAYMIEEGIQGTGSRPLTYAGITSNMELNHPYPVEVRLDGQNVALSVDGIKVLDYTLTQPLEREQVGISAFGTSFVSFGPVEISFRQPAAFVVMQFTSPFDELFQEVIRPVCAEIGIEANRASDIYRPGVILQDIIQGLAESDVIIAEITPTNPNVFYELGYAHALHKPVIVLAERGTTLPFDVSGYRVIFYENAIRGKSGLEAELRQHLNSIFG